MKNAFEYEAELAALREEVARRAAQWQSLSHEFDNIDKRLADAERRNEQLIKNLGEAYEWGYSDGQNNPNGYSDKSDRDACVAALNPTEAGASE